MHILILVGGAQDATWGLTIALWIDFEDTVSILKNRASQLFFPNKSCDLTGFFRKISEGHLFSENSRN